MRGRTLRRLATAWAASLALAGCGVVVRGVYHGVVALRDSTLFHTGRHGPLSAEEKEWAQAAWKYFENNLGPTGLVSSVDHSPSATMWDAADHLAAAVAARALGLISERQLDERLSALLQFLNTMPLFLDHLPNRFYSTADGKPLDDAGKPGTVGWSAIDLGRLLLWLRIVAQRSPELRAYVDRVVLRFSYCDAVSDCGVLHGGVQLRDRLELLEEGRLGYETYAAEGFRAWGFNTARASRLAPFARVSIDGVEILYDARDPRLTGTFAPVLSGPYLLSGLELEWERADGRPRAGGEPALADLAARIYAVQEAHWRRFGVQTARTDHPLAAAPFFVFDSIFVAGYPWNTISDRGDAFPDKALVSTRAVFGLWALWRTGYTDELMKSARHLYDPQRGWFEGRYERTGGYERTISCGTNAMVLESLLYKQEGKLFGRDADGGYWSSVLKDPFRPAGRCFPSERAPCRGEP